MCAHAPHLFNGKEALADEGGIAGLSALSVVIAHALKRDVGYSSTNSAETVEPEVKHQASDPPRLRKGFPGSSAKLED